jgi:hypothetical protein
VNSVRPLLSRPLQGHGQRILHYANFVHAIRILMRYSPTIDGQFLYWAIGRSAPAQAGSDRRFVSQQCSFKMGVSDEGVKGKVGGRSLQGSAHC